MKVTHWTLMNGSGLHQVARTMAETEAKMGLTTVLCDTFAPDQWGQGMDADIHVVHSHIPDELAMNKATKMVSVEHGSPEHAFELSAMQGVYKGYGAGDSFSIAAWMCRRADAVVTFWARHVPIWASITPSPVYLIPMGVDREYWQRQEVGPLAGSPSLLTAENAHTAKWPIDMFLMWPWIVKEIPGARLHAINIPTDQIRLWYELSNFNSGHYTQYVYPLRLDAPTLRNFLSAASFYYSPVRYGDFNRIALEAASCGCKVISFEGNEYAHHWVREGDQRRQFEDLIDILSGEDPPRDATPVPTAEAMTHAMMQVYAKVLA